MSLHQGGCIARQTTHADVFVGRGLELEELSAGLEDARNGRGRLFLLSGEPGIGKSRLVDEFSVRARESGIHLLWGRCWEAGGAPPYWPWVQLLRSYLREQDADAARAQIGAGASDIAQMLPEIRDLFPDLPTPPTVDPDSARFQLFDSTTSFLLNAARGEPLVLILEDLHASDTPSLLLLRFLADQIGRAAILIVATYRDVELTPEHPLTTTVAELSREPSTRQIPLRGLTENDVVRFVSAATGVAASPQLASALHRETNGNPLFLGEAVRLLAAEGGLGQLSDPAALRVAVPRGVRDVIGRRVGHLDDECRRALSLASVLGPEFTAEALRRLSEISSDEVLDVLDRAAEAGLVARVPGALGRFRFSHELVRATLYEELTSANRMRLHRRAADVLREIYASDEIPHIAELAHHFFEAAPLGESRTAVDYARRAGEEAVRSLAYEEAARLYRMAVQALELEEPIDEQARGELLLAQGDAQDRAGDLPGAKETFLAVADIARRSGAADQLAQAALLYGGRFVWSRAGNDPKLLPLLQDALMFLGGGDDHLRVRLLARLACAQRSSAADRERNDALSQQAVEMARKLGDPSTLAYALTGRLGAIWWPGNSEERLELVGELIPLADATNDRELVFMGHFGSFAALWELGRSAEARHVLESVDREATLLRQPAQQWLAVTMRGLVALLEGAFGEVEELIAQELQLGEATQSRDAVSAGRCKLFLIRREQGRAREVQDVVRASAEEFPWYPLHAGALILLLLDIGETDEARSLFDEFASRGFELLNRDNEWLFTLALFGEAAAIIEDRSSATSIYDLLLPFKHHHAAGQGEGTVGVIDRSLGLLADAQGRLDEAERHLRDAVELNERMGAKPWTAHSRYGLADVLLKRDGPGDRERAIDELRSALDIGESLGMTALVGKVARRLEGLGRGVPLPEPSSSGVPSVFRREGEYWTVVFDTDAFRLKDAKGLQYLAKLLAEPGREFHVLDLVGERPAGASRPSDEGNVRSAPDALGDAGALLDPQAKEAYRRRLADLEEEIEEAESMGDADRAEKARSERDFIAHELAAALGLGGRDRMASSAAERARVNVTRAIKSSLVRIVEHSPTLGRHLERTVRTGTYCAYEPDPRVPVSWQL